MYCDNYCVNVCRRRILLQGHREWKSCCTCWQLSKWPAELKKGRKGSQMLSSKLIIRLTLRVSTLPLGLSVSVWFDECIL